MVVILLINPPTDIIRTGHLTRNEVIRKEDERNVPSDLMKIMNI